MPSQLSSPSPIEAVRQVLAATPGIELAFVFGSVAHGRQRPDSDIDVAVQARAPLTAAFKLALIGDLAQATGRAVDLIDLRTAGEPLLGQILGRGRRVIGDDQLHARLVARHLIDAADFMPCVDRLLQARRRAWIGH